MLTGSTNNTPTLLAWSAYLPVNRLERQAVADAWDGAPSSGWRSVAGADEDAVTMAVEAAERCLKGFDSRVDAIFFASCSSPFAERQVAALLAEVLGVEDAATWDVTGTLRSGLRAVDAATAALSAGRIATALVVAAEMRPAEPGSAHEQTFGDGAGALLLGFGGPVEIVAHATGVSHSVGPWRRSHDGAVQDFDPRLARRLAYASLAATAERAVAEAGVRPSDPVVVLRSTETAADAARLAASVGGVAGSDSLPKAVGFLGTAHPIVSLTEHLDTAGPNEVVVVGAWGEGSDAVVLRTTGALPSGAGERPVEAQLRDGQPIPYHAYVQARNLLALPAYEPRASPVTYWRDRHQALRLEGVRCDQCGAVQFPANRACRECMHPGPLAPVALAREGTVFTFTLDHLAGGRYVERPTPRAVVDLDGGSRIFLEMTDMGSESPHIGTRVTLVLRNLHDGSGRRNYYWKARPAMTARTLSPESRWQ